MLRGLVMILCRQIYPKPNLCCRNNWNHWGQNRFYCALKLAEMSTANTLSVPASTIQYNSDHQQRLHEWQWNSLFRSWKASICTPRASKYSMLLISPTSTIKQICTFATDYENCWTAFTPSPQHQSCRSVLMYSIYLNIYFLWFQSHSARGLCFKCPRHLITVTVVNLWFIPVTGIVISPNFHSLTRHYDQHDRPRLISGPRISVSPGGDIKL